jgi:hypothetical protein
VRESAQRFAYRSPLHACWQGGFSVGRRSVGSRQWAGRSDEERRLRAGERVHVSGASATVAGGSIRAVCDALFRHRDAGLSIPYWLNDCKSRIRMADLDGRLACEWLLPVSSFAGALGLCAAVWLLLISGFSGGLRPRPRLEQPTLVLLKSLWQEGWCWLGDGRRMARLC